MMRRKVAGTLGFLAIAISLVMIGLSMTSVVGDPSTRTALLASGFLVLTACLILIQIRFFREGDARRTDRSQETAPPADVSAPRELKNPRQRIIWSGMEKTRALMSRKEMEARAEKRRMEKALLGLTGEEEILYAGERSWLSFWPAALLSVLFIAASTVLSGVPAFLCLGAGLAGLCTVAAAHRLTRYYITNFRVLVRRRSLRGGGCNWTAIDRRDIVRCSTKRMPACNHLIIEHTGGIVAFACLNPTDFDIALGILRERIADTV